MLDFLSSIDVGKRIPAEEDAVSNGSEGELREWLEELEGGLGGRRPGGKLHRSFPRRTSWRPRERARGLRPFL